jgi:hypothetical protein
MPCISLRAILLLLVLSAHVWGQGSIEWKRFDVFAELDNEGAVLVTETLVVKVDGQREFLDRIFARGIRQGVNLRKIVRMDGDRELEVADVRWSRGELFWRIKKDTDPGWNNETLVFRLQYDLEGAIAPAWDVPIGPGTLQSHGVFSNLRQRWCETAAAWRGPLRRYRFDHEVLFARFSAEGPRQLDYRFKYGTAWKHPQPSDELNAQVTPDVGYRVTELRDYLKPGVPPAISIRNSVVRVGSIFVFAIAVVGLWIVFAVGEGRSRGWLGLRADREWFQKNIASIPPEILTRHAGSLHYVNSFPFVLARWRSRGLVEVCEDGVDEHGDPLLRLRLLGDESNLKAYERTVLKALFPKGRETTSGELQKIYAKDGFDPELELSEALDDIEEDQLPSSPSKPSRLWRALGGLSMPLLIAAFAFLIAEAFLSEYNDFLNTAVVYGGGLTVICLLAWCLPKSLGGLGRAMIASIPLVAAIVGLISMHLYHTLPLRPEGAVGLALVGFAIVTLWLCLLRGDREKQSAQEKTAALGQIFVRRELRREHPNLDDAWLPQIVALGCGKDLARWKEWRLAAKASVSTSLPGMMPSVELVRPFTASGDIENRPEQRWADDLVVFSEDGDSELDDKQDRESTDK